MSPAEIRSMPSGEIVKTLSALRPSDEAVAWLAAVISNPVAFEGVRELRSRFTEPKPPRTKSGRCAMSTTLEIDGDKFKAALWRRRLCATEVGPLMDPPRSSGWASVMAKRGRMGLYAADALAVALGCHLDALIAEIGTPEELARLEVV